MRLHEVDEELRADLDSLPDAVGLEAFLEAAQVKADRYRIANDVKGSRIGWEQAKVWRIIADRISVCLEEVSMLLTYTDE